MLFSKALLLIFANYDVLYVISSKSLSLFNRTLKSKPRGESSMSDLIRVYQLLNQTHEVCFNVESERTLTSAELKKLYQILSNEPLYLNSELLAQSNVVEIGPRLQVTTPFSSSAVSIAHACRLNVITRIEQSRRLVVSSHLGRLEFIAANHDPMTESVYAAPLATFSSGKIPEPVRTIRLIEKGMPEFMRLNQLLGLGMDTFDLKHWFNLFVNKLRRNPTDVELFQLAQANSDHSRHWFFNARIVIDGKVMPYTLFQLIKSTLFEGTNSVIAFHDNSSGIRGFKLQYLAPVNPGQPSSFVLSNREFHVLLTAETHNHPTGISPFPGAATGAGGEIRDEGSTGQGSVMWAGFGGVAVGHLHISGFDIPGETIPQILIPGRATSLQIFIEGTNGICDYRNKIGAPLIAGFLRSFGFLFPDGRRVEPLKPVLYSAGLAQIAAEHIVKGEAKKGMSIVQIGGPAFCIGLGGGAASSMEGGANTDALDFASVQRGDPEMQNRVMRVIRACIEMGLNNLIISIHDQGAGGPCNVLTELIEKIGGLIYIRKINLGDKTLSLLEIWSAEYQERVGLLVWPSRLAEFKAICDREKVPCEILGEVTGDHHITVVDDNDGSTPVNLPLADILGEMPQKTYEFKTISHGIPPLVLPQNLTIAQAVEMVFKLPQVGSKSWVVHKGDRSVTGLVVQQQCVGRAQIPISDSAVMAQGYFGKTGAAVGLGEVPNTMLVNPAAGARMSIAEAMANMAGVLIGGLPNIKSSVNWMWSKQPGEGVAIYEAAEAVRDFMLTLGIAADGGKDSMSMASNFADQVIRSIREVVIAAYADVPNYTKMVNPAIKSPGKSLLALIDASGGKARLGGSALAQACSQVGTNVPDIDDQTLFKNSFLAIQELVSEGLILSIHDRIGDGGLITAVIEMCMASNCGFSIKTQPGFDPMAFLFAQEAGWVIEIKRKDAKRVNTILSKYSVPILPLGSTLDNSSCVVVNDGKALLNQDVLAFRTWWERVSYEFKKRQSSPETALEEYEGIQKSGLLLPDTIVVNPIIGFDIDSSLPKPKVAIIRDQGSNSDREMAAAFKMAGFEPWDITMTDVISGRVALSDFRGIALVGGFSYADALGAGRGWANVTRFNPFASEEFANFYARKDTFSLGVCNGFQKMAEYGLFDWRSKHNGGVIQPRLLPNKSRIFESRLVGVRVYENNNAIMLQGMEGSVLNIHVAHGEGRFSLDYDDARRLSILGSAPLYYVDGSGERTTQYPYNPNGSEQGIAAICSLDGRHLAMMPHPERTFINWQMHYLDEGLEPLASSPWLQMFVNARIWCDNNK